MLNPNYLELVKAQLTQFAAQSDFETVLTTAFGTKIDRTKIFQLRQQWLTGDFSLIPPIEVLTNGELGTANGGYAGSEDKIFVSSDFIARNQNNSKAITGLLLEEFGHKIDRFFNGDVDSAGDEGDIFSRLVRGETLSAQTLAGLKAEDDTAVIIVDGRVVSIEQQDIIGGDGNDYLNGGAGNDRIFGLAGDDDIYSRGGDDDIYGGAGNDRIFGNYGAGGNGNNRLYGEDGNDFLNGANGNDRLYGGTGNDRLYGNDGNDILYGGFGNDFLIGEAGNDTLYGEAGNDVLNGGTGNDYLYGGTGDDYLRGGTGDDYLRSDTGNDTLYGEDGNDILNGEAGNDTLDGGTGDDTYRIDADVDLGTDNINDASGIDTLDFRTTTTKAININLNKTNTQAVATNVQLLIPVVSIENVYGGTLNDTLTGNHLNNILVGGGGIDILTGGAGNDILTGGAGNDSFLFNGGAPISGKVTVASLLGKDTISDFSKVAGNQDKIVLSKSTFTQITTAVGELTWENFHTVSDDMAALFSTSSAAILYSSSTGNLFYNQNGATLGVGANGGIFATVTGNPVLAVTDFSVVA